MKNKKGFTLAEIIAVIVILGITAMIVVPPLVRSQIEARNRTRLKEIVRVYDYFINKITTENDLKSVDAIQRWADDDCENTSSYFKATEFKREDGAVNKCKFRVPNGLWLDIEDPLNPKISFDDNFDPDKTFEMVSGFDNNGSLRVNDLSNPFDKDEELKDLYAYMDGKKTNKKEEQPKKEPSAFSVCKSRGEDTCVVNGVIYEKVKIDATEITTDYEENELCVWNADKKKQECGYKSVAQEGEYYVAAHDRYDDNNFTNEWGKFMDKLEENCESGDYDYCGEDDLNYNIAGKLFCESHHARMANIAEVLAMKYNTSKTYVAEMYDENTSYMVSNPGGRRSAHLWTDLWFSATPVCIGTE